MTEQRFTPTVKIAANAKRGLKLRAKFDRGGTDVGVRRAEQLAAREPLDEADITSMASYFARHTVDKEAKSTTWGDAKDPSAGYIAWLLWGGDEAEKWAQRHRDQL